jgi:dolichyl-phosphate beta-glucosyltransferase
MSLVIPAYNEEARLPGFLAQVRLYMEQVFGESYEVIVVDDGSGDATGEVLTRLADDWPELKLTRHAVNAGKGAAVRTGVQASAGEVILFADADGACPVAEERKLREAIRAGADIAIGSRHTGASATVSRRWYRYVVGWCFAGMTRMATGLVVRDTQCGFKMFRRTVAQELFAICSRSDYLFDIFVLMCAHRQGRSIKEIGVAWMEIPGSHVRMLRDSWTMLLGLVTMRIQVERVLRESR